MEVVEIGTLECVHPFCGEFFKEGKAFLCVFDADIGAGVSVFGVKDFRGNIFGANNGFGGGLVLACLNGLGIDDHLASDDADVVFVSEFAFSLEILGVVEVVFECLYEILMVHDEGNGGSVFVVVNVFHHIGHQLAVLDNKLGDFVSVALAVGRRMDFDFEHFGWL